MAFSPLFYPTPARSNHNDGAYQDMAHAVFRRVKKSTEFLTVLTQIV